MGDTYTYARTGANPQELPKHLWPGSNERGKPYSGKTVECLCQMPEVMQNPENEDALHETGYTLADGVALVADGADLAHLFSTGMVHSLVTKGGMRERMNHGVRKLKSYEKKRKEKSK